MAITAQPLAEAVAQFDAKTPVGSVLRSAQWAEVPLALRQRALFSAGVESARTLQGMRSRLAQSLQMARDPETGAFQNRSRFIGDLRRIAAEEGLGSRGEGSPADLRDITSRARLGLVYDMQTRQAQGYARRKSGLSAGALDAVPAWELVRVLAKRAPRGNWPERFRAAASDVGDRAALAVLGATGRMLALKTSPLWTRLSRFGTPFPPFDYSSGMGLRDVRRAEAERLGLIEPDALVDPPARDDFNEAMAASVRDIDPDMRAALQTAFGPQLELSGNSARWSGTVEDYEAYARAAAKAGRALGKWVRELFPRKEAA